MTGAMPDIVMRAWKIVWDAENHGSLHRAYATDLE